MLPPPKGWRADAGLGPVARLWSFALIALAVGCGGGGTEPPPPQAASLALIIQPSTQSRSRVNLAAQPVVQLQDDQGAAVSQEGVPITVSIANGGGSLSGTTTVSTASNGQATFVELAVGGAVGPRTLVFTSPNLTPVTSATIDLSAGTAAAVAANGGDGQSAGAGNALATAPSVVVRDADDNPVGSVPVTFEVTAGGGTVDPATAIITDGDGVATVSSWTLGLTPGLNSLRAMADVGGPAFVFAATGLAGATISGTITVSNGLQARTRTPRPTASAASIPLLARSKVLRSQRMNLPGSRSRSSVRPERAPRVPRYTPDELIVTFRAPAVGAPALGSAALASRSTAAVAGARIRARLAPHISADGLALAGVSPVTLAARLRVRNRADLERVAAALRSDPAIATVERNRIVRLDGDVLPGSRHLQPAGVRLPAKQSNDPLYPFQAWHYGMIDAPGAWSTTTGSATVLVAVIDNGIRFDHPAIADNLTSDGYDFVSNGRLLLCSGAIVGSSGDGDGYDSDPTIPADYDFDSENDCAGELKEAGNHGLHVAGTIGAVGDDGVGVTGINWSVRIRPIRVLDVTGRGTDYDIAQGLLYAAGLPADDGSGGVVQAATGAKIINMSLGGPGASTDLQDAVEAASNAGALIIAAAGNAGTSDPNFPAAYPQVLSVSAVGPDRTLASYSSFGSTVDIAAPGGDIGDGDGSFGVISTVWNFVTGTPSYETENGTSMAAPHVSGVAALILARNPGLDASQLRSRLTDFAVDVGDPGPDDQYGAGIVNARNSLAQNLAPPRQLRARLFNALSGSPIQTVPVGGNGSYSFEGVTNGTYHVFAGQDEDGDQLIGIPGRRWGAFGGVATPTSLVISGAGTNHASFAVGLPSEVEPNGTLADAAVLPVGGYFRGTIGRADVDVYRVLIPEAGQYTFETSPVQGACGFALEEDTVLGLYDENGDLITSNDDIDADAFDFCSGVTATLEPGTYHVGVQGISGGVYRVQARSGP